MYQERQERLIRAPEFMELLGIKKSKFYAAKKEGKIPSPVSLTKRSKAWPASTVERVIEDIKSGQLSL
ncbi:MULTISPECIES: helix-turn-helix transcriptional regulator [Desulfovibrio]|uniref:Transcriptional regulator, AlpA family n=2 Tax=Desulfovibrio TaxID=872 RepID=A0AA94L1H6_DESDE|nr:MULTISPECIES: AlpA family phage regulatory protein [Desulfovibrio]ATD81111.1 AlpA family phage regulatory protein [Desulfovibrio sp. G11]SFW23671.1 transcriptional regulator, AlpA family [Desulfovibrio desulfuricans]SPD36724.1 DNA-binding transcriptional activator AlpA [Desulfovibrio sp. G11]